MMLHEISASSLYTTDPPTIRATWSLRDIVIALRVLDWYAATAPDGTED